VDGEVVVQTALGELTRHRRMPAARRLPGGQCDVLLRADDIVHDDDAPVKAEILRKAFRGSEFLYTLRLRSGETCWPMCPATMTTASANGSASGPGRPCGHLRPGLQRAVVRRASRVSRHAR
jgi:hypothetical protein